MIIQQRRPETLYDAPRKWYKEQKERKNRAGNVSWSDDPNRVASVPSPSFLRPLR